MKLTNTTKAGRAFPNGAGVEPGQTIDIPDAEWDAMKAHPVVQGWIEAGDIAMPKADRPAKDEKK